MAVVALGAIAPLGIMLKAVVIGLGNSMFHVSGGAVTLRMSRGKAAPLGVFVAPGAFGVTIGTLYPSVLKWMASALIIVAVICFFACKSAFSGAETKETVNYASAQGKDAQIGGKTDLLPVALLTIAVAVRAVGGYAAVFTWKDGALDALLLTLFVFLGKAAGGFVCDRFGAGRMSAVTITAAAVLTAFFAFSMPLSLAGQFLLNLSMPVTLWLLYRLLPQHPGTAFGLAASALWPGTIAGQAISVSGPPQTILILLCFIFGLGAIMYSERVIRRF